MLKEPIEFKERVSHKPNSRKKSYTYYLNGKRYGYNEYTDTKYRYLFHGKLSEITQEFKELKNGTSINICTFVGSKINHPNQKVNEKYRNVGEQENDQ